MARVGPIRALLVEDNPADATLTQTLLAESLGPAIRTRCAERLSAAVRCLEQEAFDVVILDLLLPDTIGLEGLRKIVRSVPGVPVVILSGMADEGVEYEAFDEGAQEFLAKGARFDELGRAVEKAISRKRIESELLHLPGSPAASMIAGDDVISATQPIEVLAIGPASVEAVRCATGAHANCFLVYEAHSLGDALKALKERSYDAIVLHRELPDAWAADIYTKISECIEGIPVLLLGDPQIEPLRIPEGRSQPFCQISYGDLDATRTRRLLISATLRKRALDMPSEARREKEAIPQPNLRWYH